MDSATWTSTNQGCPSYSHCRVTNLPQQRTTLSPSHGTISWDDHPATWWHVDYIKLFLLYNRRHSVFVLTEIHALYTDLPSLHAMLLPKVLAYTHGMPRLLSRIPYSIFSDQENQFSARGSCS
uniref:Uncharacterized protein n=1 Tax=Pipistrellus kuhlii TaxID=59472 RepID=A0A7J7W350_PIPKU|nr:hypothetical protein mPipKuh1_008200 [Pipistrellus kuhlii]